MRIKLPAKLHEAGDDSLVFCPFELQHTRTPTAEWKQRGAPSLSATGGSCHFSVQVSGQIESLLLSFISLTRKTGQLRKRTCGLGRWLAHRCSLMFKEEMNYVFCIQDETIRP